MLPGKQDDSQAHILGPENGARMHRLAEDFAQEAVEDRGIWSAEENLLCGFQLLSRNLLAVSGKKASICVGMGEKGEEKPEGRENNLQGQVNFGNDRELNDVKTRKDQAKN